MGRRRGEANSRRAARTDWCTPTALLDKIREVFPDGVALDPCDHPDSVVHARERIMPERYSSLVADQDNVHFGDGLAMDWGELAAGGLIYVNFPYGRGTTKHWIRKCAEEAQAYGGPMVMLGPSCPNQKQFDPVWDTANLIVFPPRLRFGGADWVADFDNVLVVWCNEEAVEKVLQVFKDVAAVVYGWNAPNR